MAPSRRSAWSARRPRPRPRASATARDTAGALDGVPIGVKDLYDSEGVRTTYGSGIFADHVPRTDAEALRRARRAGAILLGKTQTHEFAWGISSVNHRMGSAHNPWDVGRIAGGSSGGSAVALAAELVPLALGTDTGGSIRIPSSFCGTVGLKPTYGRVSSAGIFPLARTLDHPGPMARSPDDAALLLAVVAGFDPADPATALSPPGSIEPAAPAQLAGLKVGLCADLQPVGLSPAVAAAIEATVTLAGELGASVREVALPEARDAVATYAVLQRAEALAAHQGAGLYPARAADYGEDVRGWLELAREVGLSDYLAASAERERLRAGFRRVFDEVDLLLTPVSACSPFEIGQETAQHLGVEHSLRELVLGFTVPHDLAGLPACALRAGFDELGCPVGLQIAGPPWSEVRVLGAARALYEASGQLQARRPVLVSRADGAAR